LPKSFGQKALGLLRAAALNPYIPAAAVEPPRRIALWGGFFVRFAAREGRSAAYGERQNVVIPLKTCF